MIADSKQAQIYVGIEVGDREQRDKVLGEIQDAGFQAVDMTDSEIIKVIYGIWLAVSLRLKSQKDSLASHSRKSLGLFANFLRAAP